MKYWRFLKGIFRHKFWCICKHCKYRYGIESLTLALAWDAIIARTFNQSRSIWNIGNAFVLMVVKRGFLVSLWAGSCPEGWFQTSSLPKPAPNHPWVGHASPRINREIWFIGKCSLLMKASGNVLWSEMILIHVFRLLVYQKRTMGFLVYLFDL